MSCSVTKLSFACRLRGMTATQQTTKKAGNSSGNGNENGNGNGNGGSGSGSVGGGGSSTAISLSGSGIHVGSGTHSTAPTQATTVALTKSRGSGTITSTTMNVLQESNSRRQRQRSHKPCGFCWCCCCSCSWARCLILKTANDAPGKRGRAGSDYYDGELPPLDEIRSWGKSFDRLMRSTTGRKVFRDFLRSEFSEENILFWLACEDLKKETSPEMIEEKARLIYEDYISILSPREVSLDSRVREIVNRNMIEPTTHTFDEAQIQIYTLMHRDSYPRFLNSQRFKAIAQLQDSTSVAGSKAESPT